MDSSRDAPALPVRLGISWLTNAVVLAVVAAVLTGVHVKDAGALLLAAAVFGVLNTVLKPLLRFVTLPLAFLTFGIAWFFVSLLMLLLTKEIVDGARDPRVRQPRVLDPRPGDADRMGGQPRA